MSREPHDPLVKQLSPELQERLQDRVRAGIDALNANVPGWRPWFAKLLRNHPDDFVFSAPDCCIIGNIGRAMKGGELTPLQVEVGDFDHDDFWLAGKRAIGIYNSNAADYGFDFLDGDLDEENLRGKDIYAYLEQLWRDAIAGRFK